MAGQSGQADGRGARVTEGTLLHRQVHPSWVQQGRVTSQVFRPTPKDKKKLSVYDGDKITADKAWEHFTTVLMFPSVGVLAVTVAECKSLQLTPAPDPEAFPEHALIDFTPHAENQIVKKSKLLKACAETRGWQYQAGAEPHLTATP